MIKIDRDRVDCPPSLNRSNKALVESDYQRDDVLDALLQMQHLKCCYCEKDLSLVGKTAKWVDHFVARTDDSFKCANKKTDWNEANAWENLLYACSTCNSSKGAIPPFNSRNRRRLIDPSHCGIDPEDHIGFSIDGDLIFYETRGSLGKDTIENLKLERRTDVYQFLRKRRLEIDGIFSDLVHALSVRNNVMADSQRAHLTAMTSAHLPHAAFSRIYIIQKVDKFNNNDLDIINQRLGTEIQPITVEIANGYEVKLI